MNHERPAAHAGRSRPGQERANARSGTRAADSRAGPAEAAVPTAVGLAEAERDSVRTANDKRYQPDVRPLWAQILLYVFIIGPFAAVGVGGWYAAAVSGITVIDAVLFVVFYGVSGHGVTIGFHRLLTHRSFTATRRLRIALAVAGSMALEGSVIWWVADHRKHHAFSDADGDPHSPWRYGTTPWALTRGLWWSHVGWLFDRHKTYTSRYAPDLLADADIVRIDRLFPVWALSSLALPGLLGWALTGYTWHGAWTALLWAGLVRIFLIHHVTFSINSVCHVVGSRPFANRDRATNVRPLAVLSMGESWHNYHHADPTSARHGVEAGQLDSSAAIIRLFERLGWATRVRWPDQARVDARRQAT
jgi:stearoyl-CoA desaturase (delta-9 desaturase)